MKRWSLSPCPLKVLPDSAHSLGIATLSQEPAPAGLGEHGHALHSPSSPWWAARHPSHMCVRLSQASQLLAEHRCSPAKVSHARPRLAEPPQLTCRLESNNKWLLFEATLSCLPSHQSSCPGDFLLNILASSCSSPSALVPLSSSPLTWALHTEGQREDGTAQGHKAEKPAVRDSHPLTS